MERHESVILAIDMKSIKETICNYHLIQLSRYSWANESYDSQTNHDITVKSHQ